MIKLQSIHTDNSELYSFMEELLIGSFPPEEYRCLNQLRSYTDEIDNFYNNIIYDNDQPIGFITYWDFDNFCYVEHFAMSPSVRNGGFGKKTLEHVCEILQKPIVLEVERPTEEMAKRRIGFYQRQGFVLWENDYLQPPYKEGDDFLPLYIMAYGNLQPETDYETVRKKLHTFVYGVKED